MEAATQAPPADPELPGEGEGEHQEPELMIEGDGQLTMIAGGHEAQASEMTMRGGSINVDGEFEKGEYIDLTVRVRVAEVHFVDKYDGTTGEVIDTVRRHVTKIERLERADD